MPGEGEEVIHLKEHIFSKMLSFAVHARTGRDQEAVPLRAPLILLDMVDLPFDFYNGYTGVSFKVEIPDTPCWLSNEHFSQVR